MPENIYDDIPAVMTVKDLCEIMDIGRSMGYSLVQTGAIESIRVGRCVRITRKALLDYLSAATT